MEYGAVERNKNGNDLVAISVIVDETQAYELKTIPEYNELLKQGNLAKKCKNKSNWIKK